MGDFCNNIKHKYRFQHNYIDENSFDPDKVFDNVLFEYAEGRIRKGTTLYRARDGYLHDELNNIIKPLPANKMGIPDNTKITSGRANPPGINYLYTADEVSTVLAEIRAWKSSVISVAEVFVKKDLKIVDLSDIYEISSPFDVKLNDLKKDIEATTILKLFASDLSKPINPNYSVIDYLPTQYICELIKINGFDGIKFKSSLSKGNNIILYNAKSIRIQNIKLFQVKDISYEFEEYE